MFQSEKAYRGEYVRRKKYQEDFENLYNIVNNLPVKFMAMTHNFMETNENHKIIKFINKPA